MKHHFLPYPLRQDTCRDTEMGKNYLAVQNIQVIGEGELVNRFAIKKIRVLFNHHLFTKRGS
jgi:hypothetical protein